MLRHGTASEQLDSTPQIGQCFRTSLVSINRFPAQPYEVNFKADRDVVTIAFGLCTGQKAYDADRRTRLYETPGTAYFHPAGSEIYVLAEESSELLCFSFDRSLREELIADMPGGKGRAFVETVEDIESGYASAIAPVINSLLKRGLANGSIQAETLAINFFDAVLQRALYLRPTPRRPGLDSRRLRLVLDYIETHLQEAISLTELSRVGSLQLNHFIRAFKQATGLPPHRYLLTRRVERAKDLLRLTDISIAHISYLLNFSSQAHFTNVFKSFTRATPFAYRIEH